jgi:hypothetical protein
MAERERPDPLERRLAALAAHVEWPPAPDLRAAVRAGVVRSRRRRLRLLLLAAAIAAALTTAVAAAAATGALRGVVVQRVPRLASPAPAPQGPLGARLELGERRASVADAEAAAGFRVVVPASLGQPDEVYYAARPGVVTLVYRPRPGLPPSGDPEVGALVMEARATVDEAAFGKLVAGGTHVERVTVNGGPGYWISGAPHGFLLYRDGTVDRFRLAGDVLVWNQAGLVVRIESGLDRSSALAAAGTARPSAV